MPYICLSRSDIPDGTLQVLDLWPNTSQRNQAIDPAGQTKYVNRYQNDTLALSGTATAAEYKGLAAYFVDHVVKNAANIPITAAVANLIAGDVAAAVDAGTAVTLAVVNASIQARTGDATSTLTTGNSNGTLADVLKICAGGEYVLPAGTTVITGVNAPVNAGSFTSGQYRATYEGSALYSSIAEGQIAGFSSATFEYGGTTGAALVVYDDSGNALT
ncbi:MAG: hypothetical protein EBT79_07510 [Actinobacteria bacterium]|nr:hypothetical protein [Actinomycetota bacterium]NBR67106.1 hypothetical protein [Actinomycetota bacterium]